MFVLTRWIVAGGALVVSLDSTVNIALPAMGAAFHLAPEQTRWVIVCYVFTYALTSFAGGALGDRIGHARVFRAGLLASALASVLCGVAPTFGWLLAGRIVLGVAGGLVYGPAPGLVTLAAPPAERGRVLGLLNAGIAVGFAAGPIVAGALVARFGWPAVFHVRAPLALALFAWALVALPAGRGRVAHARIAVPDFVRAAVLYPGALAFLANAGIFAVWLLAPFYLVERRALTPEVAGFFFMLTPLGTAIAAPLAGRVSDRLGPWWPLLLGLAVEAAGLRLLAAAGPDTRLPLVALGLGLAGFGLGVFQVPNMVALMAAFPPAQQGAAGGFAFLARTLGVVAGVSVFAEIFGAARATQGFDVAYSRAFLAATLVVIVALLAALRPIRRTPLA